MTAAPVAATRHLVSISNQSSFSQEGTDNSIKVPEYQKIIADGPGQHSGGNLHTWFSLRRFLVHFAACCSANPGLEDCKVNAVSPRVSSVLLLPVGEGQRESSEEEAMMI